MKILGVGSMFTLAFIGGILFMVSVGCGGSDAGCVGSVTFQGKAFEGKGKSADEAKKNACNVYCREADPEFEARYRIWLDSPKGKAAGSPSKQESIFKEMCRVDGPVCILQIGSFAAFDRNFVKNTSRMVGNAHNRFTKFFELGSCSRSQLRRRGVLAVAIHIV
jgi:hypothetical protein